MVSMATVAIMYINQLLVGMKDFLLLKWLIPIFLSNVDYRVTHCIELVYLQGKCLVPPVSLLPKHSYSYVQSDCQIVSKLFSLHIPRTGKSVRMVSCRHLSR